MHKFKSLSKCINNNNSNNSFIKSSKYLQSTTRLLNNNLNNNVFNNNQVSNSLINASLLQQYQKRDSSFLSNIKSNFMYLLDSDPENAKLLEDFDRVFLNSRFKKQREEQERKKKEMEEMMAEYARAAEERARAEAHLSPEELKKKREEEQRLYEEILSQQKNGGMRSRVKSPLVADEASAQKILRMQENVLGRINLNSITPRKLKKRIHKYYKKILRLKLNHSLFDFDTAQNVKFYTPNGTDQEVADVVNRLKAIKERVEGKRPSPIEPDREEPTFEDCQDFYLCQTFNIYQYDTEGNIRGLDYGAENFMGIEEHIKLALGTLEEEFKFLEEVDKEARSLGIQYENIDWESFKMDFFNGAALNQAAVDSLLPKEYLEFLNTKLNVQYASEIENAEKEEEKMKDHELELANQGLGGRSLNAEDHEKLYPVPSKPVTPEDLGVEQDPIHIRLFDKLLDKIPEDLTPGYTNKMIQKTKRKVHPGNDFILKHWEENMPGMSLDRLLVELRSKFLPNYIYHYLRGNLDQLKKYTDEEFWDDILEHHKDLEGANTILNHELIGVSKLKFHKFMATIDTTVLKVSLSCIHRVGLRDYNGHPIALSMEDRYGLYETHMTFYLSLYQQKEEDQYCQNRFGWNVHYIYPSKSVKVLDLVPDREWEQSKEWKVEQIRKERVEYYKQKELKEKEALKEEEEKKAKELKEKKPINSNNNNNNNSNNKSDQNKSKSK